MDNPKQTKDFYLKCMSQYSLRHPEKKIAIELCNIYRIEELKHIWGQNAYLLAPLLFLLVSIFFLVFFILNGDVHWRINEIGNTSLHYLAILIVWTFSLISMIKFINTGPGFVEKKHIGDPNNICEKLALVYQKNGKQLTSSINQACFYCLDLK